MNRHQRLANARKAAGLCVADGRDAPVPGKTLCERHLVLQSEAGCARHARKRGFTPEQIAELTRIRQEKRAERAARKADREARLALVRAELAEARRQRNRRVEAPEPMRKPVDVKNYWANKLSQAA